MFATCIVPCRLFLSMHDWNWTWRNPIPLQNQITRQEALHSWLMGKRISRSRTYLQHSSFSSSSKLRKARKLKLRWLKLLGSTWRLTLQPDWMFLSLSIGSTSKFVPCLCQSQMSSGNTMQKIPCHPTNIKTHLPLIAYYVVYQEVVSGELQHQAYTLLLLAHHFWTLNNQNLKLLSFLSLRCDLFVKSFFLKVVTLSQQVMTALTGSPIVKIRWCRMNNRIWLEIDSKSV